MSLSDLTSHYDFWNSRWLTEGLVWCLSFEIHFIWWEGMLVEEKSEMNSRYQYVDKSLSSVKNKVFTVTRHVWLSNISLLSAILTEKLCTLSYFLNSLMKKCKEKEDWSRHFHFHFHLHKPFSVSISSVSYTGIRYSAQLRAFIYRVQGQSVNDLYYRYVAHYLGM